MSRISICRILKINNVPATALVLALSALLVGITFAAQDKFRADVCFWQHHAQAN
jgi:hypothetical protein